MKRRSPKRQAELDALPAIASVSTDRTPIRPSDASFREFVRRLPCVVCLVHTLGGDPCHRLGRRRFGDWLGPFELELTGNLYPACRDHHTDQHTAGINTFASGRGIDLAEITLLIGRAYQRGWSADGLGAAALARRGYAGVDVTLVLDGELPC
jgi:hypothetical protein